MTLGQHCDEIIRLIDEALAGTGPVRPRPAPVRVTARADQVRRDPAEGRGRPRP